MIIDIDKPLLRCLCVDVLGDGVESMMLLKYERLPDHCYSCGRLGHKIREFTDAEGGGLGGTDHELLFEAWLRAASPIKRSMHCERPVFHGSHLKHQREGGSRPIRKWWKCLEL